MDIERVNSTILVFNATTCFNQYVSSMVQNCSDTLVQYCVNTSGIFENQGRPYLTEYGCETLCGKGFGFWDPKDTLLRLFLWVVPAIVLIVHYHFPALHWSNHVAVILHILGDPIDCLWSMLIRIDTCRHFYHLALFNRKYKCSRAIATIWSAYDEIGYQDASQHFADTIRMIRQRYGGCEAAFLDSAVQISFRNSPTLPRDAKNGSGTASRDWMSRLAFWRGKQVPPSTEILEGEMLATEIAAEARVIYVIQKAAQELISTRSESAFATWVAIGGLVSAIGGAYVRTWSERLNNQTSHTIATVTLLFVIAPIVKLSGNIGAFTSSTAAVSIIQQLREELGPDYELFPSFTFSNKYDEWANPGPTCRASESKLSYGDETAQKLENWPRMAAYSGMNSCWRPMKWQTAGAEPVTKAHSEHVLLPIAVFLVLFCCYLPALLVSYYTPLRGFACRSMAWTLIAAAWVLSALADRFLQSRRWCATRRVLWRATIAKDAALAAFIALAVLAQQIGVYNSCWCRSGYMWSWLGARAPAAYVNLWPLTDAEWDWSWSNLWLPAPITSWGLNLVFILVVERFYSDSRKLLNRDKEAREAGLVWVNRLARRRPGVVGGGQPLN